MFYSRWHYSWTDRILKEKIDSRELIRFTRELDFSTLKTISILWNQVYPKSLLIIAQMLLLMCQYLQSTQNPNECWAILAVAIRGAQSIGLHTPPREGTPLEKELRKRAWYGCVYLDR